MIADRYTKVVLTIIAFALAIIAAENAIQPSRAYYGDIQKVQLCDVIDRCAEISETRRATPGIGGKWDYHYGLDVKTHSD
jgi:hypothetical protein